MGWIEDISEAIRYIEENITEKLQIEDISAKACRSAYYFQKGFSMLCGQTVGEYVRQRRLSLAGSELAATDAKVIDLAVKYGYDSPDSFTKAFTRFHGATPTAVRKEGAMARSFSPLRIKLTLEGGAMLDYRITEKETFTITGKARVFNYETAMEEIPKYCEEYMRSAEESPICPMYGVCIEGTVGQGAFEYLIADDYKPWMETPQGFVTRSIPRHTWAVFACRGPLPGSLQDVNRKIFSQWLQECREYEIAAAFNIEMYSDPSGLPKGNADENYYSEIWIPVKRKKDMGS